MTGEFKSHTSYWDFSRSVMQWRYIRSPDDEDFLRHVASTAEKGIEELPEGSTIWRAQVGCKMLDAGFDYIEVPFDADRMKPPSYWRTVGQSSEGRTNPTGIPFLYTATNQHIAISEVKPSPGHFVTVAEVRTNKALRIVNVTTDEGKIRNIIYVKKPEALRESLQYGGISTVRFPSRWRGPPTARITLQPRSSRSCFGKRDWTASRTEVPLALVTILPSSTPMPPTSSRASCIG